jgi:hypothetical protein
MAKATKKKPVRRLPASQEALAGVIIKAMLDAMCLAVIELESGKDPYKVAGQLRRCVRTLTKK